jgi:hypothetical protein
VARRRICRLHHREILSRTQSQPFVSTS